MMTQRRFVLGVKYTAPVNAALLQRQGYAILLWKSWWKGLSKFMKFKVLALDGVAREGLSVFNGEPDIKVEIQPTMPEEELVKIISDYDAVIVRSATKVTKCVMDGAPKLRVIARAGVGVDNIDLEEATRRGILVVNAPGANTISATEHTMAMMLALARNIPQANAMLKSGVWNKKAFIGSELCRKTLGIIGLGRIGSAVAKRAQAMEMHVVAYDPYITESRASALGVELLPLDEVLERADFITVHTPKTKNSEHMLDARAFAKMKDGVRVINCARGGIIDENALYEALKTGKVAGAALDVFENEPTTDSPLFGLDNVIVTPHLGASTEEAQINVASDVAREVVAALKGRLVKNTVNIPAIKPKLLTRIKPYINLAEKLGRFQSQMVTGRVKKIEIRYSGEVFKEIRPITTALVKGLLDPILQEKVNFVNALVLAKERGIQVEQNISDRENGYASLISVKVTNDNYDKTVAGTLFRNDPRIVMIDGYRIDAVPEGHMLVVPHIDKPGMIGRVGTILGEHNINIAGMQNGRKVIGGKAVMVLSVDSEVPQDVLDEIAKTEDIMDVKMVNL